MSYLRARSCGDDIDFRTNKTLNHIAQFCNVSTEKVMCEVRNEQKGELTKRVREKYAAKHSAS